MSDLLEASFDDEPEDEDERQVTVRRSDLKALQRIAKTGKKALERSAELERTNAFYEAGIPAGDKRAEYFRKGYGGELNPDAIKAEWDEFSGGSAPEAASTDPAEAAAHQRVSEASTGAEPPKTSITVEDLANADSTEEVMRLVDELGMRFDRQ